MRTGQRQDKARAQGIKSPYVFYVEELGPGIVKMGLRENHLAFYVTPTP